MREIQLKKSNLEFINLLKKVDKFVHFSDEDIQSFLDAGTFREYAENEIVIKDGALDNWVYLLLNGTLIIEKDGHHLGTLKRCGDMFGEMGAIDGSPRSATIRVTSKTLLLTFDSSIIEQSLRSGKLNFCYLVYRLFSEFLAARLRNTTEEVVKLKNENINVQNKLNHLISKSSDRQNVLFYEDSIFLDGKRILIVDAVEATRKILKSIMRDLKFKDVFVSGSVKGALKILGEEDQIDIIVSDWQLTNMTGLDLLREVRIDEKFKKIPFILLVNESAADNIETAISLDVNECLMKPFNVNTLHEKIKTVMKL
jgi:CheY-like chemotaxis protein